MTIKANGYAAYSSNTLLEPFNFERRTPRAHDVVIDILYCGVCHSDIHCARNEWAGSQYPLVPGHEIIGRVVDAGDAVRNYKRGDIVGVGCMVDSCQHCNSCAEGLQQYCDKGFTGTYNGRDTIGGTDYKTTFGGYSTVIVVDEQFVLRIPPTLDIARAAPLLCAGITTYSPLKYWRVGAGQKVGIIGLGGLGHMGVKFASAMGADVVVLTSSPEKSSDARKLGAKEVLVSTDTNAMSAAQNSFDFLLNTIPVGHNINPYMALLKRDATMVIVGALESLTQMHGAPFIVRRRKMAGSLIGGIPETQEMLDFCGKHGIACDVEQITIQDINLAFDRTVKADVKYRFVIDMASLKS